MGISELLSFYVDKWKDGVYNVKYCCTHPPLMLQQKKAPTEMWELLNYYHLKQ